MSANTMPESHLEEMIEAVVKRVLSDALKDLRERLGGPHREWYSIKDAAALTGLSSDHVRRAVVGRMLLASNQGTPDRPLYSIRYKDIEEWMEKRKAGAAPPTRKKKPMPLSPHLRKSLRSADPLAA